MNKHVQILTAFNSQFLSFISDVRSVFPDNTDIQTAEKLFKKVKENNPKMTLKIFKQHFYDKYKQQIDDGDLDFFINKDYSSDLSSTGNSSAILEKIDLLRKPVAQMGKENQDKVLQYMKNLNTLCSMYIALKPL